MMAIQCNRDGNITYHADRPQKSSTVHEHNRKRLQHHSSSPPHPTWPAAGLLTHSLTHACLCCLVVSPSLAPLSGRFLLGDALGQLFLAVLTHDGRDVQSLHLEVSTSNKPLPCPTLHIL